MLITIICIILQKICFLKQSNFMNDELWRHEIFIYFFVTDMSAQLFLTRNVLTIILRRNLKYKDYLKQLVNNTKSNC